MTNTAVGIGAVKGSTYPLTMSSGEVIDLPRVTSILSDAIAKPALINWAANQERTLVIDTAADIYEQFSDNGGGGRVQFIATLKAALGPKRAHRRQLEKASDIGTAAHKMIEWTLRDEMGVAPGPKPDLPEASRLAFEAWQDWREGVQLTPVLLEQPVYSLVHGYAGTLDFYGSVEGLPTIVDWKTSSAIYPEARLQNAAYRRAFMEMQPDRPKPVQGMIVRLPKKEGDEFEVCRLSAEDLDRAMYVFTAVLDVWNWLRRQRA